MMDIFTTFLVDEGRCETKDGDNRKIDMPEGLPSDIRCIVYSPEDGWWMELHDFDGRRTVPQEFRDHLIAEFDLNKKWGMEE